MDMNLQQVKVLLEKINRLYDTMALDPQNVDSFEKDLMMSYTRHLYSLISGGQAITSNSQESGIQSVQSQRIETVQQNPALEKPTTPPVVQKNKQKNAGAPTEPHVPAEKASSADRKPSASNSNPIVLGKEEIEHIFEAPKTTDLLDKLNQSKIPDLNKAMGINEKLFTIKELFGGDQKAFETCINTLNGLSSFEEAKSYMSQTVASRFHWSNKEKVKKAKNFVKLVWRRYN